MIATACIAIMGAVVLLLTRRQRPSCAKDLAVALKAADISCDVQMSLDEAIALYHTGRTRLLARLKALGVEPLPKRQAVANFIGKHVGAARPKADASQALNGVMPIDLAFPKLIQLHFEPHVFVIRDFLSAGVCDEIVRRARVDMRFHSVTGSRAARTASSTWFNPAELRSVNEKLIALAPAFANRRTAGHALTTRLQLLRFHVSVLRQLA